MIPMIELRAIGPSDEIARLLDYLRTLAGVDVASVSGAMRARTSGSVRYYLSARLTDPHPNTPKGGD